MLDDYNQPFVFPRRGILLILSAPSGTGKTTLAGQLLAHVSGLRFSISYTTRPPREGEVEGRDYHFVSESEFTRLQKAGAFAEWAQVHGALYGTSRAAIDVALAHGQDLVLDIDVQGAQQMKARYPEAVSVFVFPPSWETLEYRLRRRGTNNETEIAQRLQQAQEEAGELCHFDYWLVNDQLDRAKNELCAILTAERARVARLHRHLVQARLGIPCSGGKGV